MVNNKVQDWLESVQVASLKERLVKAICRGGIDFRLEHYSMGLEL